MDTALPDTNIAHDADWIYNSRVGCIFWQSLVTKIVDG